MRLSLSTHLLVYGELDQETLDALSEGPLRALELWFAPPHFAWDNPDAVATMAADLARRELSVPTVHLPCYPSVPELLTSGRTWSLLDADGAERELMLQATERALAAAAILGAEGGVLHLGWPSDPWTPEQEAWAVEALERLIPAACTTGVRLLTENIVSDGTRTERLCALLSKVDPEGTATGICFDTGHANMNGGVLAQLEAAGDRLHSLHLHDNAGEKDHHLPPGEGTVPWEAFFAALDERGFDGWGAVEIRDYEKGARGGPTTLASVGPTLDAFLAMLPTASAGR